MKTFLAIFVLTTSALAQQQHTLFMPGKVAVEWHFYEEHRVWLSINSFAKGDWVKDGYHPSFTYVLSQYEPVVKKLPNGQWQITFTSDIARDIP